MMTEKAKELLGQAQTYQQQLQVLLAQKEAITMQLIELKKALEELGKTKETEVYRISGPILIRAKKTDVKKDLQDKEKIMDTRVKTIETNEKRIKDKLDELRQDLTKTDIKGAK